jgi:hypothetical protein
LREPLCSADLRHPFSGVKSRQLLRFYSEKIAMTSPFAAFLLLSFARLLFRRIVVLQNGARLFDLVSAHRCLVLLASKKEKEGMHQ